MRLLNQPRARPTMFLPEAARRRVPPARCSAAQPRAANTGLADRALLGMLQAGNRAMLLGCRVGLAMYRRAGHGGQVMVNVPYGNEPHQVADVYKPLGSASRDLPIVVYAHGGGFVQMDRDTHWTVAMPWADQGCIIVVPRYTKATKAPYPAALRDYCAAIEWAIDHAPHFGGNPQKLVLAGESAGANLAIGAAACFCYERPEPFAQRLFARDIVPKAVFGHSGTYQLTEWGTLYDNLPSWAPWLGWPIVRVTNMYLGDAAGADLDLDLASPLRLYESQTLPARPLPFFRLSAGGKDPLSRETERFAKALDERGAELRLRIYEDAGHISHLSVLTDHAKQFWLDMRDDQEACGLLPKAD